MPTSITLRSPLHHWHLSHGVRLGDVDGWQMPVDSTNAALTDLSHVAKTRFLGAGVATMVEPLLPSGASLRPGQVAPMPSNEPTLLCRLRDDHLLILSSTATDAALNQRLAELPAREEVSRWNATTALACFGVNSPRLGEFLAKLTQLDVSRSLAADTCAETNFAGVPALLIRVPGSAAELRVAVAWDVAEYVWERMHEGLSLAVPQSL